MVIKFLGGLNEVKPNKAEHSLSPDFSFQHFWLVVTVLK